MELTTKTSIFLLVDLLMFCNLGCPFYLFPVNRSKASVVQSLERINFHLNSVLGSNFTLDVNDFPGLDHGTKNQTRWEGLPTTLPLNLSIVSINRIRELLPADLLTQSIFLNLAIRPSAAFDDEGGPFKPKPISVLMNFGIDGNVEWTASNDDKQDDCHEIQNAIYDPFGHMCRPALCPTNQTVAEYNECLRRQVRKQIAIPVNATEATIFVALGLAEDTDWHYLARDADYCFERRVEEVLRDNLAEVLHLHPDRIQNVTVPDFIELYHNISMERQRWEAQFPVPEFSKSKELEDSYGLQTRKESTATTPIPLEMSFYQRSDLGDSRVEASFVLIRPLDDERRENETRDSIVEMYAKLVDLVTADDSFDFLVDNITVEVYAIWENDMQDLDYANRDWCQLGIVKTYINEEFTLYLNDTDPAKSTLIVNSSGRVYSCGEFKVQVLVREVNETVKMFQTARVCDRSVVGNASCKIFGVTVKKDEVQVHENQSMTYDKRLYSYLEYELDASGTVLYRCGEDPKPKVRHRSSTTMGLDMGAELAWFFFVLSIISVVALILTLIIYLMFKELRTLPGWNLINVMIALICAQTAQILSSWNQSRTLCHIVGIATHYGYLVQFFFANVIAIDIYRTFGRRGTFVPASQGQNASFYTKLRNNLLYCHLSTTAIVVGAIILDYHEVPRWEVHYREDCWIVFGRASLAFFALPVMVICLANAVLICLTIHRVRMHNKSMKAVRVTPGGGSSKQKNKITAETAKKREISNYVKIGTVFGFTWFFGIFMGLLGQHTRENQSVNVLYNIIAYIFIITQSCQGLMMFFTFGLASANRARMKKLWKTRHGRGCDVCDKGLCRCVSNSTISTMASRTAADNLYS